MKQVGCSLFFALALSMLLSCNGDGTPPSSASESQSPAAPEKLPVIQGFGDYTVSVRLLGDYTRSCEITFYTLPKTSEIAAKVIRSTVERLVEKDGTGQIWALAYNASGELLPEIQYDGSLWYKASDGQIMTMAERIGLRSTESDQGTYSVRVEDRRARKGITLERKWHHAFLVFRKDPRLADIKSAVLEQIEKLKPHGLDLNVYIYTGNKSNKITWKQMRAGNGEFMTVKYVARTGEITANRIWD